MKKIFAFVMAAIITAQMIFTAVPVYGINSTEYMTYLNGKVNDYLKENESIPGLAMSVVDLRNGFSVSKGYGYRDRDKNQSVTGGTLFQTGEISGSITALAALVLQKEEKIKLGDKASDYFADLGLKSSPIDGGSFDDVTIRQLMEHASGIPDEYLPGYYSFDKMDLEAFNNLTANVTGSFMNYEPYKNVSRSNLAISLLGYLLASVKYPDQKAADGFIELTNEILEKIGMENSSFNITSDMKEKLSHTFDSQGEPTDKLAVASGMMPALSMWSSSDDMKNYLMFILNEGRFENERLLNFTDFDSMFRIDKDSIFDGEDRYYGLSWFVYTSPYGKMYRQLGDTGFHNSVILVNPEQRIGIFLACNSSAGSNILTLAQNIFEGLADRKTTYDEWWDQAHISVANDYDEPGDYTGWYYGDTDAPIQVSLSGGILYITDPVTGKLLAPDDNNRYVVDEYGNWYSIKFYEDQYYLLKNGYPSAMKMIRLKSSKFADGFYGSWKSSSESMKYLGRTLTIEKDTGGLAMMNGRYLNFLSENSAYVYGFGRQGGINITRGADETGEYILYCGERFYKQ